MCCMCRHAGACLTLELEFLFQLKEGARVCDRREGVDRLYPLSLFWAKSFSPDQGVVGKGGHPPHLLLGRSMGRCPE